jgi:hypothetical protein
MLAAVATCDPLNSPGLHPAAAGAGSQDTSDTSGQPHERVEWHLHQ